MSLPSIFAFGAEPIGKDAYRNKQPQLNFETDKLTQVQHFADTLEKCNRDCHGYGSFARCRQGATFKDLKPADPPAGVNGVEPQDAPVAPLLVARDSYRGTDGTICSFFASGALPCTRDCVSWWANKVYAERSEEFRVTLQGDQKAAGVRDPRL
eukprot:TRINITY_DN54701_c0_g1_i1.p1 TRINITY_DN54701_c0_g1~~TRINITY_DN54701_c0_g1_i1.p1  ORF type:complete len:154 (+),score=1.13 TRINITY_DN54701_c0_g1_i1:106-567(+)